MQSNDGYKIAQATRLDRSNLEALIFELLRRVRVNFSAVVPKGSGVHFDPVHSSDI
jgi:hypothetical protein